MRFFPDKKRHHSKHEKGEKGEKGEKEIKKGDEEEKLKKEKPIASEPKGQTHSVWVVYGLISFTCVLASLIDQIDDRSCNRYVGAMLFSNYALKFVDYPTQVIAKSCKPIPGAVLAERT